MSGPPTAPQISPRHLHREALRVLPVLAREGVFLAKTPGRTAGQTGDLGAFKSTKQARPTLVLEAAIAHCFIASDWLEQALPGRWVITAAGKAWLKRAATQHNAPFAAQHQERRQAARALPDGRVGKVLVNDAESPLGWLRRRRGADGQPMLTNEQFQAGERLRADFTKGQLVPSTTASWSGFHDRGSRRSGGAGAAAEISDFALAARQQTERALGALSPEMGGLLVDVCCLLIGLEEAERQRKWSRRSAKVVLQLALTELARHYGILDQPPAQRGSPARRARAIRSWGDEGYRPQMFADEDLE